MIVDFVRKRLGYHVCEEFTRWEKKQCNYERPATIEHDGVLAVGQKKVVWTVYWMERKCTTCGMIYQKRLKN